MAPAVLLIAFNRPDLVAKQLEQFSRCGIREVYIALDGPRSGNPQDDELCKAVREIVVNHPKIAPTGLLEHKSNLGCSRAPVAAISWFLEQVGEGIILEDDCYPDPSFFEFCGFMLKEYKNEEKIFSIAGSNWFPPEMCLSHTHFFSIHPNIWGWATWHRAWRHYDADLTQNSLEEWKKLIDRIFTNVIERRFWKEILRCYINNQLNTWDYAFVFSSWYHGALHVVSSKNLISNLGFRADATHTGKASSLASRELQSNPGPYSSIPIQANEFLDRVIFSERFHTTSSWANGLFREEIVSKLESELAATRQALAQKDLEIASYFGLTGAFKALRQRFCKSD